MPDDETKCPGNNQPVTVNYTKQPLDHFANSDTTWQQVILWLIAIISRSFSTIK